MRLLQGKKLGAILLATLVLTLSGCSARLDIERPLQQITYEPGVSMPVISPYQQTDPKSYRTYPEATREWALYYRVRDEDFLVRVMSSVDIRDNMLEESLIEALINGPKSGLAELIGVFPAGTRIIDTASEGDTLLLTLSYHFLDAPSNMPAGWRDNPSQKSEVYLRRRLALASIVSTITEETRYSAVQLYITSDENDAIGRRISRSEIFENESDILLSQIKRSEEYLLTHFNAADIILRSVQTKNIDTLYKFISGFPEENTFLSEIFGNGNRLTAYSLSSGMVSNDGQNAILIANLVFENTGGETRDEEFAFRIEQENSLWKIKYDTLKRMMEAT